MASAADFTDIIATLQDAQRKGGALDDETTLHLAASLHRAAMNLWADLPPVTQEKKTVIVKVDGSAARGGLHQRTEGWRGGAMYGPPVPGAIEGLQRLLSAGFAVVAQSIRLDQEIVAAWLRSHGVDAVASDGRPLMYWNGPQVLCTRQTISHWAYYGPRASDGPWQETVDGLLATAQPKEKKP